MREDDLFFRSANKFQNDSTKMHFQILIILEGFYPEM